MLYKNPNNNTVERRYQKCKLPSKTSTALVMSKNFTVTKFNKLLQNKYFFQFVLHTKINFKALTQH